MTGEGSETRDGSMERLIAHEEHQESPKDVEAHSQPATTKSTCCRMFSESWLTAG